MVAAPLAWFTPTATLVAATLTSVPKPTNDTEAALASKVVQPRITVPGASRPVRCSVNKAKPSCTLVKLKPVAALDKRPWLS